MKKLIIIFTVLFLSSCTIPDDVIKDTGNSIAKVQVGNAVNTVARAREEKIVGNIKSMNHLQGLINNQLIDEQPKLIVKYLDTKKEIAKNTFLKGVSYGSGLVLGLNLIFIGIFRYLRMKNPQPVQTIYKQ